MDLEDGATSPKTESENYVHVAVEQIVFILVIFLFWIIWTFYNTFSFIVRRGKHIKVISFSSSHPTVQTIVDVVQAKIDEVQAKIDEVIDPIVQMEIKQFFGKIFEVLVLSLFLLVWVGVFIIGSEKHCKECCMHSPQPNTTNVTTQHEQLTADNVGQAFRNNTHYFETTDLNRIFVYSCPLTAPFSSSTTSFRSYIQRQYLPVDYHAYIVFHTGQNESEMWWALDKQREGIFLSWGINEDWVVHSFKGKPRAEPIKKLAGDSSRYPVSDLARSLRNILKSNEYDLIENNCQHFSKEIFDKFATDIKYKFTTPIDLTSPLSLTIYNCSMSIIAISILYELYLLFMKSRENDYSYYQYQYTVYFVTVVSLILLYFNDKGLGYLVYNHSRLILLYLVLPYEAVLYAPLYTIRKRGAQYREMCRSGNIFNKCWLSVCFVTMYTLMTYLILVRMPLEEATRITSQDQPDFKLYLSFPLYYLTSLDFAIPTLHGIASWLSNIFCYYNEYSLVIPSLVLTGFYLNLQDLAGDTRKIFVSNIRPSTILTRRASCPW